VNKVTGWLENPVKFVRDQFNVEPDVWQAETLMAMRAGAGWKRRIAMKACTGPGKSAMLAWIGWYRLSCFAVPNEHPKGAAISGEGWDNLRDNLWAELAKWQTRSPYLMQAFQWSKEQIYAKEHPETWFLSARSYAKDADSESIGRSLSGLHSKFPFILLDETGDMPLAVGQKAEQIFTGVVEDGLIAAAGNPTSTTGLLYEVCTKLRESWQVITITADPDDPRRTPRVDIEHARDQIKKYGRDNPWVMATILGEFPASGFNSLLSVGEVEAAMNRRVDDVAVRFAQKRLGVDCARFGDDRTVIFPRQGLLSHKPVVMRNARSNEIAARVIMAKNKWGSELEFIDDTGGYGSGVVDSMIQAGEAPMPINFAGKAIDSKYQNRRAEMWFRMSEWVKRGGSLPQVPELVRELTAPSYTFINGKFSLEKKEQIKDRLGFSPDLADALVLTFALDEMPGTSELDHVRQKYEPRNKVKHEWDPIT
jgi:phage terminase large subunit